MVVLQLNIFKTWTTKESLHLYSQEHFKYGFVIAFYMINTSRSSENTLKIAIVSMKGVCIANVNILVSFLELMYVALILWRAKIPFKFHQAKHERKRLISEAGDT